MDFEGVVKWAYFQKKWSISLPSSGTILCEAPLQNEIWKVLCK